MIETSSLSLIQICALAKRPRFRSPTGKSQGPADALKTIYWFRELADWYRATSPYALGKRLEPEGYVVSGEKGSQTHMHRNKWSRYARGESVPQANLLHRINRFSDVIIHPLWDLLDRPPTNSLALANALRRFSPEVQIKIGKIRGVLYLPLNVGVSVRVEHTSDLSPIDALGANVYLLCEANILDKFPKFEIVKSIYLVMLTRGAEFYERGVSRSLFELIQKNLIHKTIELGAALSYSPVCYVRALKIFNAVRDGFVAHHHGACRQAHVKHFNKYFYAGDFGENIQRLAYPIKLAVLDEASKEEARRIVRERRKDLTDCLTAASNGKLGRMFSPEVRSSIDCVCKKWRG